MQDLQRKYDRLRDRNSELEQLVDAYAAVIEELTHQRDALMNAAGSQNAIPFHSPATVPLVMIDTVGPTPVRSHD